MTRIRIARALTNACLVLSAISLVVELLSASIGILIPIEIYFILAPALFAIGVATQILQFRVELIEREWPLFTFESIRTLYRRFPIWTGGALIFLFLLYIALGVSGRYDDSILIFLSAIFLIEYGALRSLLLQPWLLDNLLCPNGHAIRYFNRFCPSCGIILPRIKGCA